MNTMDITQVSLISTQLKISESEVFLLARRLGYLPCFRIDDVEYFAKETIDLMKSHLAKKRRDKIENDNANRRN